jgi:hypothetical protein
MINANFHVTFHGQYMMAFDLQTHELFFWDSKKTRVLPPRTKKDLKRWLKATSNVPLTKELLLTVLNRLYTDEEANVVAGSILAARMLI